MRILIDCRFAAMHVGLGRYTRHIVQGLIKTSSHEFVLLVKSKDEGWIPKSANVSCIEISVPHYSFIEQIVLPKAIVQSKADIFFCPHFNVPIFCPIPFVATVHDLILHRYPNTQSVLKKYAYKFLLGRCIKKAKNIIAVSNFTKQEICTYYPRYSQKISVIHEGIEEIFTSSSADKISALQTRLLLHKKYILYVGNAKEHKNVQMLIDAFSKSTASSTHILALLCFGPEVKKLQLKDNVIVLESIADADLPVLYSGADLFATASLYDGFCFPVLEARACGARVLATNTSAIPEVAGNCTVIAPKQDEFVHWLNSIDTIKTDTDVSCFDWKKASLQTLSVLESTHV